MIVSINGLEDSRSGAAAIIDDEDGRTREEAARVAIWSILSHVQDRVALETARPWPAEGATSRGLPLPAVRVEGDEVWVWFGDASAPVLALPPFPLTTSTN